MPTNKQTDSKSECQILSSISCLCYLWASSAAVWRLGSPGWGSWLGKSARRGGTGRRTAPSPSGGEGGRPASARWPSAPPCLLSAGAPPLASAGPSGTGQASPPPPPPAKGGSPQPGRAGSPCPVARSWLSSTRFQIPVAGIGIKSEGLWSPWVD